MSTPGGAGRRPHVSVRSFTMLGTASEQAAMRVGEHDSYVAAVMEAKDNWALVDWSQLGWVMHCLASNGWDILLIGPHGAEPSRLIVTWGMGGHQPVRLTPTTDWLRDLRSFLTAGPSKEQVADYLRRWHQQ